MRGRISFADEDEEGNEGQEPATARMAASVAEGQRAPRFVGKGMARRTRGLTTESATMTGRTSLPLSEQVRDRVVFPGAEAGAELGTLPPLEEDEWEGGNSREQTRMVQEARRVRREARNRTLLEDYISLEKTTQAYMDPHDIHVMVASSRAERRRRPPGNMWEDPDDVEEPAPRPTRLDSESEDEAPVKKALDDEEEYEAAATDGRLAMKISDMDDRLEQASLQETEDEETRIWELQQIHKGMSSSGTTAPRTARKATSLLAMAAAREQAGMRREPIPSLTIGAIKEDMVSEKSRTQASLRTLHADLDQVRSHQVECQRTIDDSESSLSSIKEKTVFFREVEDLIKDHAELTDEVMGSIEMLEREHLEGGAASRSTEMGASEWERCLLLRNRLVDPAELESRLSEWKHTYPQSFADSYVELCLPQLWEPYIRLEFIGFNLFAEDLASVDKRFQESLLGCLPASLTSSETRAKAISSFVAPWLCRLIRTAFDPRESAHYAAISQLLAYLKGLGSPTLDHSLSALGNAVIEVLLAAPEEDCETIRQHIQLIEAVANDPVSRERFGPLV